MRLEGVSEIQASKIIAGTTDQEIFAAFRKVLVTTIDERKTWFSWLNRWSSILIP